MLVYQRVEQRNWHDLLTAWYISSAVRIGALQWPKRPRLNRVEGDMLYAS